MVPFDVNDKNGEKMKKWSIYIKGEI